MYLLAVAVDSRDDVVASFEGSLHSSDALSFFTTDQRGTSTTNERCPFYQCCSDDRSLYTGTKKSPSSPFFLVRGPQQTEQASASLRWIEAGRWDLDSNARGNTRTVFAYVQRYRGVRRPTADCTQTNQITRTSGAAATKHTAPDPRTRGSSTRGPPTE